MRSSIPVIAAKTLDSHIRVLGAAPQRQAVQIRSGRICRGELTAEWCAANPDLISGENSAEALLERIKAEREAANTKPNKRRVKA